MGMLFSAMGLVLVSDVWADAENRRKESGNGRLSFLRCLPCGEKKQWNFLNRKVCGLVLAAVFFAGWGKMALELKEQPLERYLTEVSKESGDFRMRAVGILTSYSEKNGYYSMELSEVSLEPVTVSGTAAVMENVFEEPKLLVSAESQKVEALGEPACGMKLEVCGEVKALEPARNPGGFDAGLYYRGKKISCRLWAEEVWRLEEELRPVYGMAEAFRKLAKEALEAVCCSEDRGIFQAVLLGDKTELPEETEELFQENGIAHILAVSGLHVSMIGMTLYSVLRMLGLGYGGAGMAASVVLLFYGSVAGFGSSVFRAICMVMISFFAGWLGRTYDLLSAMALSLLFLAVDSPLLLCSGGLQLSYAAVLAVGMEQEWRKKERRDWREKELQRKSPVAGSFSMGASIQLMTFPILLFHFYEFPVWGIFLNLLVIPLMSYAAGSGILAAALYAGSRYLPAGQEFLLHGALGAVGPGHYIFRLYRELCSWAGNLPFSSVEAGRPELWKIVLYYTALFLLYRNRGKKHFSENRKRRGSVRLFFLLAVGLLCTRPIHGFHVWFLDVGQGDCILMQTGAGTILSDCGSSQEKQVGKRTLVPFLKSRGIRALDYVLVSHGDIDHMNGVLWLLENEPDILVKVLGLPLAGYGQEEYEELCKAAENRGTEIRYLSAGEQLRLGSAVLHCIHPDRTAQRMAGDSNSQSLVFHVKYDGFSMLLTGDIGEAQEAGLAAELSRQYKESGRVLTVLKAAHHGSAGSSSEEFLDAVSPQLAVLSYGKGNVYGHPAPQAVKRLKETGARLWGTADAGAIHMVTDGEKLKVSGFLKRRKRSGEEGELQ